jgi:hypothetical protein
LRRTNGYTTDTLYNVELDVHSIDDDAILIFGYPLPFISKSDSGYYFYQPASGGGHHAIVSGFSANYVQLLGRWPWRRIRLRL